MAKAPMTGADMRPRIYMRQRGDTFQTAGNSLGPWKDVTTLHDAIDLVAGPDAADGEAVIFWGGISYDT